MPHSHLLAYDPDCGACSRFKALVEFFDARHLIEFASLSQADKEGRLDAIAPSERYRSFHLVERETGAASGPQAILPLVSTLLPKGRFLQATVKVPGLMRAIRFGYFAASRLHNTGDCAARS